MKVSVIIPVFNAENYLEKCLDSVLGQTLDDYEVIIINDGSTDSSQRIIDGFCSAYPDRIVSMTVENGGQGRAKNFGLDIARGEYVINIDSDDYIAPDMLEKMYSAGIDQSADVVICDFFRVTDGVKIYESSMLTENPLSAVGQCWNKLFRKSLIGDVRYPSGLWYEDTEFSGKLLIKSEKTVFVHEALYFYNIGHPSTMRNSNTKKNLDIIRVLDHIREFAAENRIELDFDYFILTHVVLEAIKRVSAQKTPDSRETVRTLRDYARTNLPDIGSSEAFRSESRNRRIIMWLNYHGYDRLSNFILGIGK